VNIRALIDHQPLLDMSVAARRAACCDVNRPNIVAPLPDILVPINPGRRAMQFNTSWTTRRRLMAIASRSLLEFTKRRRTPS
jgi:hypothetical protein